LIVVGIGAQYKEGSEILGQKVTKGAIRIIGTRDVPDSENLGKTRKDLVIASVGDLAEVDMGGMKITYDKEGIVSATSSGGQVAGRVIENDDGSQYQNVSNITINYELTTIDIDGKTYKVLEYDKQGKLVEASRSYSYAYTHWVKTKAQAAAERALSFLSPIISRLEKFASTPLGRILSPIVLPALAAIKVIASSFISIINPEIIPALQKQGHSLPEIIASIGVNDRGEVVLRGMISNDTVSPLLEKNGITTDYKGNYDLVISGGRIYASVPDGVERDFELSGTLDREVEEVTNNEELETYSSFRGYVNIELEMSGGAFRTTGAFDFINLSENGRYIEYEPVNPQVGGGSEGANYTVNTTGDINQEIERQTRLSGVGAVLSFVSDGNGGSKAVIIGEGTRAWNGSVLRSGAGLVRVTGEATYSGGNWTASGSGSYISFVNKETVIADLEEKFASEGIEIQGLSAITEIPDKMQVVSTSALGMLGMIGQGHEYTAKVKQDSIYELPGKITLSGGSEFNIKISSSGETKLTAGKNCEATYKISNDWWTGKRLVTTMMEEGSDITITNLLLQGWGTNTEQAQKEAIAIASGISSSDIAMLGYTGGMENFLAEATLNQETMQLVFNGELTTPEGQNGNKMSIFAGPIAIEGGQKIAVELTLSEKAGVKAKITGITGTNPVDTIENGQHVTRYGIAGRIIDGNGEMVSGFLSDITLDLGSGKCDVLSAEFMYQGSAFVGDAQGMETSAASVSGAGESEQILTRGVYTRVEGGYTIRNASDSEYAVISIRNGELKAEGKGATALEGSRLVATVKIDENTKISTGFTVTEGEMIFGDYGWTTTTGSKFIYTDNNMAEIITSTVGISAKGDWTVSEMNFIGVEMTGTAGYVPDAVASYVAAGNEITYTAGNDARIETNDNIGGHVSVPSGTVLSLKYEDGVLGFRATEKFEGDIVTSEGFEFNDGTTTKTMTFEAGDLVDFWSAINSYNTKAQAQQWVKNEETGRKEFVFDTENGLYVRNVNEITISDGTVIAAGGLKLVGDAQGRTVIATNEVTAKISGVDGKALETIESHWVAGLSTIIFSKDETSGEMTPIITGDIAVKGTVPQVESKMETSEATAQANAANQDDQMYFEGYANDEGYSQDGTGHSGQVYLDGVYHNANSMILKGDTLVASIPSNGSKLTGGSRFTVQTKDGPISFKVSEGSTLVYQNGAWVVGDSESTYVYDGPETNATLNKMLTDVESQYLEGFERIDQDIDFTGIQMKGTVGNLADAVEGYTASYVNPDDPTTKRQIRYRAQSAEGSYILSGDRIGRASVGQGRIIELGVNGAGVLGFKAVVGANEGNIASKLEITDTDRFIFDDGSTSKDIEFADGEFISFWNGVYNYNNGRAAAGEEPVYVQTRFSFDLVDGNGNITTVPAGLKLNGNENGSAVLAAKLSVNFVTDTGMHIMRVEDIAKADVLACWLEGSEIFFTEAGVFISGTFAIKNATIKNNEPESAKKEAQAEPETAPETEPEQSGAEPEQAEAETQETEPEAQEGEQDYSEMFSALEGMEMDAMAATPARQVTFEGTVFDNREGEEGNIYIAYGEFQNATSLTLGSDVSASSVYAANSHILAGSHLLGNEVAENSTMLANGTLITDANKAALEQVSGAGTYAQALQILTLDTGYLKNFDTIGEALEGLSAGDQQALEIARDSVMKLTGWDIANWGTNEAIGLMKLLSGDVSEETLTQAGFKKGEGNIWTNEKGESVSARFGDGGASVLSYYNR
ncbi:MAG: hypothetical protein IKN42_00025, partial [Elusimicrobia bacterium]|nr:hypothetical protein [Elusimicrobiota bacterium]